MSDPASLPTRIQRQQAALLAIAKSWRRYESDLDGALRVITETAVAAVDVERVSVWFLDPSHQKLVCQDLYERTPNRHSRGMELTKTDFPSYFAALESEEVIDASAALADPRTSEFGPAYLAPQGIGAMLDAPIRSGGHLVGVLCHEHVGSERAFPVDEQNTASYLASLVSLAVELHDRMESEQALAKSLSLLQAAFEATGEGILAVDARGRAIAHNQRFLELWNMPEALLGDAGNGGPRLRHIASQTRDPESFVARARSLFDQPERESVDLFELVDGRSIERTSRPQWLEGKVIGRVWSYRDVTHLKRVEDALRKSEARLRELADRDALTGLYNRRHLHHRLGEEVARARRSGRGFCIAMLDLDRFKAVNDQHGHQVGDEVLRAFAADLTGRVRKTDCVGRWGGEEFLLVLPETERAAALRLVDAIRQDVARARDTIPSFTVSAGVATFPDDGHDLTSLVAVADARLYEAKHAGRNCVR